MKLNKKESLMKKYEKRYDELLYDNTYKTPFYRILSKKLNTVRCVFNSSVTTPNYNSTSQIVLFLS